MKQWLYSLGGRLSPENPLSTVAMYMWRFLDKRR